ncbi:MerR family transcriptional regulator [Nonomuraea pusilla]|uniref:MerR family transcriptional regulator n=1 Tax=Nonomuraea pusilla TaxID=46177 RepID=UPI00331B5366
MDGETLHPIGELARRTGLTVKTIRFYSDRGLVPPAGRSAAGHRLYGPDAVARLRLVRTLRALGLDLPTISRVVRREATLPEVAAAHAAALEVRIRPVVAELTARYATAFGRPDGPGLEDELLDWLETVNDPRRERYLRLLAVVNGWTPPDADPAPALTWLTRALRRSRPEAEAQDRPRTTRP